MTVARLGERYQETLFAGEARKPEETGVEVGIKGRLYGNEKRSERKQTYAWPAREGVYPMQRRNKKKKKKMGTGSSSSCNSSSGVVAAVMVVVVVVVVVGGGRRSRRGRRRRSGSIMSRT